MEYIELSDGRVGWVEDLENSKFKEDLKRLGLTYTKTTANHYYENMLFTKLDPEQIYRHLGGKKDFID